VLSKEQNGVSPDPIDSFQRIVSGGMRAPVQALGCGTVDYRKTGLTRPQLVIDFFVIHEEPFIELADLLNDFAGDQKRAAEEGFRLLRTTEARIIGRLAFSMEPDQDVIPDHLAPRSVQSIGSVGAPNLRAVNARTPFFRTLEQTPDHVRIDRHIVVERQHPVDFAMSQQPLSQACVDRAGVPQVPVQPQDVDFVWDQLDRAVGRSIVDDQKGEGGIRAGEQRVQRFRQNRSPVPVHADG
jgi:hypothetical protein